MSDIVVWGIGAIAVFGLSTGVAVIQSIGCTVPDASWWPFALASEPNDDRD